MPPHLLRCQGLAVDDYSFTLGRLEAGRLGSLEAWKLGSLEAGKLGSQKKLIGHRLKAWKPESLEAGKLGAESMEHGAERKKLIAES